MNRREELHGVLKTLMHEAYLKTLDKNLRTPDFSNNVYFQAPSSMNYPAIVYEASPISTVFADNNPYIKRLRYTITVIDANPDSLIPEFVSDLPTCSADRNFVSDKLHHFVYAIYY